MQPVVEIGARLGDRYRLDELRHTTAVATLWRATDEVLDRTVAARLIPGQTRAQYTALATAIGLAGQVPDGRWVRVLDVGSEPVERRLRVWVITEWIEGPTLTATIRTDPLPGRVATALVLSCAQAVSTAQQHGARHGALHPDEVLLPADGNPRLTGLELSGALHAQLATTGGGGRTASGTDDAGSDNTALDDTVALGALLFAALTGRWPLRGWDGLPAPTKGDRLHPREQRRGIGRELDDITARALCGDYPDAAAFTRDLARLPAAPLHPSPPEASERGDQRWRPIAWRVVPPLLVAAIGVGAWSLGSDLGRVPSSARAAAPSFPQPHQPNGAASGQVVWSAPPTITSFDPQGDGAEDPGGVGLAIDGDPSTSWTTDTYHGSAQFGGLKHGVGLLLDLRQPRTVSAADLLLSAPGSSVEIRAGSAPPHSATDLPIVASQTVAAADTHLVLAKPVTARYWLVWFTALPADGTDTYRLGVAEIALLN